MDTNPLSILLPGAFWLAHPACACLCAERWKSDMIDWRLNCRCFQSSPMCLEHPRFNVYHAKKSETDRNTVTQHVWKNPTGRDVGKMGGNGRFEIRTGKQIKSSASDCRRTLECPSILSSGFSRVVQQTLFSHNMGSTLERTQSLRD